MTKTRSALLCLSILALLLMAVSGPYDNLRVYKLANGVYQDVNISSNVTFYVTPKTDAIAEKTAAAGVTVDGLLIKDGAVAAGNVSGLGTMATQNANAVNITGGNLTGCAVGNIAGLGTLSTQNSDAVSITGGNISGCTIPAGNVSGLGTMSTQNSNAVAVTGGNVTGLTNLGASNLTSTGGNIDSTVIGGTTPAAVTATTLKGLYVISPHVTSSNIAESECLSEIVTNTGAGSNITLGLPPATTTGKSVVVVLTVAHAITIDPDGTDQIIDMTDAPGDKITSDAVVGTKVALVCIGAGQWMSFGSKGTWTDAN
jgi:hypothetical protein